MRHVKEKKTHIDNVLHFYDGNPLCQFYKLRTSREVPALLATQGIITTMAALLRTECRVIYLNLTENYHSTLFVFRFAI